MRSLIRRTGRTLVVVLAAFHVGLGFAAAAVAEHVTIPEDASLTIREYEDLGVPDPSSQWTVNEYEEALRVLGEIPRSKLPRDGSARSQLLFDRLVISYEGGFDLSGEGPPAGERPPAKPTPSLPDLYAANDQDDLLFDRELVVIRAGTLARSIKTLPTRSEMLQLAKQFAQRVEGTSSEPDRTRLRVRIQKAEETAAGVSGQVKDQASALLAIAGIPEIRDESRQELLERAEELFPRLPEFLSEDDVRWVVALLRGAASPESNAGIRTRLEKLADQLDRGNSKT